MRHRAVGKGNGKCEESAAILQELLLSGQLFLPSVVIHAIPKDSLTLRSGYKSGHAKGMLWEGEDGKDPFCE